MRPFAIIAILMAAVVSGCGKESSPTSPSPSQPTETLLISPDTVTVSNAALGSTVTVSTTETTVLSWHLQAKPAWATVTPDSGGATPAGMTISIAADTTGLSYGDHWGTVRFASASDTATLAIKLHYVGPVSPDTLAVSPDTLSVSNTALTGTFELSTNASAGLDWQVASRPAWAAVAPASGTATSSGQTISLTADVAGLSYGDYWGNVVLASAGDTATLVVKLHYPTPPLRLVGIDQFLSNSFAGWVAIDASGQLYEDRGTGSWSATSRLSGTPVALTTDILHGDVLVLMQNGDLYAGNIKNNVWPPQLVTNVAAGAPSATLVGIDQFLSNSFAGWVAIDASGQLYEDRGTGSWSATSRLSGTPVALTTDILHGDVLVLMQNGDLYAGNIKNNVWPPQLVTNVAAGAPSATLVGIDQFLSNSFAGWVAIDASGQLYEDRGTGSWSATSRLSGTPVALTTDILHGDVLVLMQNGDLYAGNIKNNVWPPQLVTNVAAGAPSALRRH